MLSFLEATLFIIVLAIIAIAAWIIHYILIELPRKQKDILDRFSPRIVNQVSLEYATLPQLQQKQIAIEKMNNVFIEFGTTLPGDTIIETTISDALYRRKIQEADDWIGELKADQIAQTDTASMPVTPPEEQWIL